MKRVLNRKSFVRAISLLFALIVFISAPFGVSAKKNPQKTVRVGWFDSSYNSFDESGRRSGYSYEYQLKVAAYCGWTYEYVEGSWSDLYAMLVNGEIDLLSDVSYTEERSKILLYPGLPMGTEEYYLFTTAKNGRITSAEYSSLAGKKVGVNKDSYQALLLYNWIKENNVDVDVVEVTTSEDDSLKMVESGKLDAYVTVDSFMDPSRAAPVFKIGSSEYYFAVSKKRPDLLSDLNYAMSKIQDEDRFYNQKMFEKYIRRAGANAFLTDNENVWLKSHGTIKVGYQDNYMAFCAQDENGNLKGVIKDYLEIAANCMPNIHIDFKAIAYPTSKDAMQALRDGEIDCMFPANLSGYEAEENGVVMSPAIMDTEIYAVVRKKDPNIFKEDRKIKVAVNEGNPNYDAILSEYFPEWERGYYKDTNSCLKAISKETADCLLISNYRYNNLSRLCKQYHLISVSTGEVMDYCFAVKKGNTELYSILSKTTSMVPSSSVNASLTKYATEDSKLTFRDFLSEYTPIVLLVVSLVAIVMLALFIQSVKSVRKARKLISATEKDDLTSLYNRKFFFQYANNMALEHPDVPMDAIVLNIEQFHAINELHGRELGDKILRVLGNEIHMISKENQGIGGRFEADRFDIYCRHTDDYKAIFERLQGKLDMIPYNANIRLRMGVMPWQKDLDPVGLFDKARLACNMARGNFKEHFVVYDDEVSKRESYEQRLINDLMRGLDNNEFKVYYQPKFDIQSEPEKIVSAEALVRWQHPELGLIYPNDFIPLFENNGQIGLLDRYVWNNVADSIALWREKYGIIIPVSVNLSRVDVYDANLIETLEDILSKRNLDHNAFKLEVTESAYTENAEQVLSVVKELRDIGYKFEMDDFGTGYSSLNMLSEMPIDGLKMDRGFVRNIDIDNKANHMVKLILDIANNLGVPVIAEGVETVEQLKMLKELGCAMVQGYYFSKPIPAAEFENKYFSN